MNMQDKVALITGATSGIGRATAKAIAASGATLYVVCRNREKGEALLNDLAAETGNGQLHLLVGDLARQADIHQVADEFLATGKPLHLLVNNAGIVNVKRQETVDGIEETFAVNHLAYFLLTERLRERLVASAPARIVSVASMAHAFIKGLDLDDPEFKFRPYKTMAVYAHSKLCNILWTRELARRLEGTGVTANCLHPGAVGTGLAGQNGAFARLVMTLLKPFFRSPEKGATASIHLALSPQVEGVTGAYFVDRKAVRPKPWAEDDDVARKLWALSETMVKPRAS
jgi:retinol dehydrogenase-12